MTRSSKSVSETGVRIRDTFNVTTENDPAGNNNKQQDYNLHASDHIHTANTPFREECVEQSDEDNDANCDTTFGPFGYGDVSCCEDVLRENNATRRYSQVRSVIHRYW